ncbi:hypothetical protein PIB30_097142, partial [Stylosanthes scabra]|nr:hypothetical protein [Stylosanthes scabra]
MENKGQWCKELPNMAACLRRGLKWFIARKLKKQPSYSKMRKPRAAKLAANREFFSILQSISKF